MHLKLTVKARRDIANIFNYGREEFGELIASRYVNRLRQTLKLIEQQPKLAALHSNLGENIRLHPTGSHVIIYQIGKTHVTVIRILRAEQNWIDQL